MSSLKNPMRFSIRHKMCDIANWLDHENEVDDIQRRVTKVDIVPSEGQVYVHWEEVDEE